MIESNNEKKNCLSFYTTGEKLCEYEKLFGEKLIQSETPGQLTKNQDFPGKTRTVGVFDWHHWTRKIEIHVNFVWSYFPLGN